MPPPHNTALLLHKTKLLQNKTSLLQHIYSSDYVYVIKNAAIVHTENKIYINVLFGEALFTHHYYIFG